jgi:hypothetical protein
MPDSTPASPRDWSLKRRCETIGRFWGLHWTAIQLVILREEGGDALARFKYSILRMHQRSHFLQGLEKLGIDRSLPPAVVAARYHYLSNSMGGLSMEYIEESPKKVWIRYTAPCWSFPGASMFAVPAAVQRAMFAGWHPFNGRALGSPRLGFVVTKVFQEGEPYDEGYFIEHDRDLDDDERLRFEAVTTSPDFDPARAPKLDPQIWPEDRLVKAKRNFALGYVDDAVQTAVQMFGVHGATHYVGHASRLAAIQFFGDFKEQLGVAGNKAADLVAMFGALSDFAGESFASRELAPGKFAVSRTNRVLASAPVAPEVYGGLFEFVKTSAKVLNPRIRVTLPSVDITDGVREEWLIEDTAERQF